MKYAALLFLFCSLTFAEERGTIELKGSLGLTSFVDDGPSAHLQSGGSARFYITRRLSYEPEFQYLHQNRSHHDVALMHHVNWDFRSGQRLVPYVSAGIGWLQSTTRFRGFAPFPQRTIRTNQTYGQFGGGMKVRFGQRWYVAPELRFGTELDVRANIAVGYTFPR